MTPLALLNLSGTGLVVVLFVLGFLLLAAEVFVPGLVLGTLGLLLLAGAVALVFVHHGTIAGIFALLVVGGLTLAGFFAWLWLFPRTVIGRKLTLGTAVPSANPKAGRQDLLGRDGVALSALRPAGTAEVDGRRIDVVAEGAFIEKGATVRVVAADGMRVVVRAG